MMGQKPQQCFMVPILVGTDGTQKMSKSLGNYIGVDEAPNDIYGKVMSIPDDLIINYFELLTDIPEEELKDIGEELEDGKTNPMGFKKRLAKELVEQLHSPEAAVEADEHFSTVFQKKEIPDDMPVAYIDGDNVDIRSLLTSNGLSSSASEAVRLIKQGAVQIEGQKITEFNVCIQNESIVKVGKRRFIKIIKK